MRIVAIYPGRFQPPTSNHYKVYQYLAKKFGKNNVYISTSNKM
jgi:phosphopantetheine adenylyltransferase